MFTFNACCGVNQYWGVKTIQSSEQNFVHIRRSSGPFYHYEFFSHLQRSTKQISVHGSGKCQSLPMPSAQVNVKIKNRICAFELHPSPHKNFHHETSLKSLLVIRFTHLSLRTTAGQLFSSSFTYLSLKSANNLIWSNEIFPHMYTRNSFTIINCPRRKERGKMFKKILYACKLLFINLGRDFRAPQ